MSDEQLGQLMVDVELALVDSVDRLADAERRRLYVEALQLEAQIRVLHDALAVVAEHRAAGQAGARPLTD